MKKVPIVCECCGTKILRNIGEVRRSLRLGRHFYCSNSCGAKVSNTPRRLPRKEIIKICPYCQKQFTSSTHYRAAKFCSSSCASAGSMTPKRIAARLKPGQISRILTTQEIAKGLKKREAWKYVELEASLRGRDYEFEYAISKYIFDLVLKDTKIIVEFDSRYHNTVKQQQVDLHKESVASAAGFKVVRRRVEEMKVISSSTLEGL